MFNGLSINDEMNKSQLDNQLGIGSISSISAKNSYANTDKNFFIDEASISNEAASLYERDQDIQKFTNLAMSDPNDISANDLVSNLFSKGVSDPYSDEAIKSLSENSKLMKDLGIE